MAKWKHLLDNIPVDLPKDKPIFMLNLLRFYDQAHYPEGSKHSPCSGQEAWVVRYVTEFRRLATEAGGFELIYLGLPASKIVGEDGEKWDAVVLVKYTNIDTFRKTLGSDDYAATAAEHRDAALKDWRLIASTQVIIPE
ncbi:hypothetical protein ETB97_006017 [Aspergillus alliaceus]|uniref:DUF1330 domain-containing protein n=1 Tax=Petromyces alliaceus TaxID=209559 RepID=A0A5N6FH74_PETAA|nr:uncharacterized protein BDW43DRAFT_304269 [Aspergillus alliaceus]KAB8227974.1 hypothetical protein BDW43DRAFT_304269 [Aspergillus alliaceus]KAE8384401.1 hypothetical protein BDV23DRAFT_177096 [Aspergillus alliaceus]KAF5857255.1 hypothetical protein ETB97_006017 [Aspergillus burnettii]